MKVRLKLSTLVKFCGGLLLLSLAVSANELITINEGIPIPNPPKAKQNVSDTQKCVEPIEEIRSDHGHILKHHRDETMHKGVRTKKHSLVGCIDCHVTTDQNGNYPSITSQEHFCRSCHTYAAVSIDCFQCHASKPLEESSQ
ncbi:electron transport protein DsrJ [Beggiatoa sp. PS]|nr:electron transport protein DsrJ [Beggiatoa sp. PS]